MPKVRRIAKPRNYSSHGHNRTCEEAPECQTPKSHSDVDQVDGICDGKAKQTEFPYLPQSWNNPPLKEAGSSPRLKHRCVDLPQSPLLRPLWQGLLENSHGCN